MLTDMFIGSFVIRVSLAFVVIVVSSLLLHYFALKLKFKDTSLDNPTSIGIILGIFYLILSYINRFQFILFLLINLFSIYLIKKYYIVSWKESLFLWFKWFITMIILTIVLVIFLLIIF